MNWEKLRDAIQKYSPDQPRDDHGRFGSGGGEKLEDKFRRELTSDHAGAVSRYAQLKDSNDGQILNTDTARELSSDYLKDRTRSAEVHEPASEFIKRYYAQKLAEEPKDGQLPTVLFTAGGTGAGKSTALKAVDDVRNLSERAQIVYDTNMNKTGSAVDKIEQALEAHKQVDIAYVYRDPVESLRNGALPRAQRQEQEHGTGRTVPVEEHAKTHNGSYDTIATLQAKYADNPNVHFHVIDNSLGAGNARESSMNEIAAKHYNVGTEELRNVVASEYRAGRISRKTYEGFSGDRSSAKAAGRMAQRTGVVLGKFVEPTGSKKRRNDGLMTDQQIANAMFEKLREKIRALDAF